MFFVAYPLLSLAYLYTILHSYTRYATTKTETKYVKYLLRNKNYTELLGNIPYRMRSPYLCHLAVNLHGSNLQYVPDCFMTRELCVYAVKNDGNAIKYVPTEYLDSKMCELAVRSGCNELNLFPSAKLSVDSKLLLLKNYFLDNLESNYYDNSNKFSASVLTVALRYKLTTSSIDDLCRLIVKESGRNLMFLEDYLETYELCMLAVENDPMNLKYVPTNLIDDKMAKMAVEKNKKSIKFVPSQLIDHDLLSFAKATSYVY